MVTVFRFLFVHASGVGAVLVCGACAGGARFVRYGFIEPVQMGTACEAASPWWCTVRTALIVVTRWHGIAGSACVLAIAAFYAAYRGSRQNGFAWAAMATGGLGLVLYNATGSAIAVLSAGLLLAARAPEAHDVQALSQGVTQPGRGQ
jgi:hypothetical protein